MNKYLTIAIVAGAMIVAGCGKPGVTVATGPNGEKVNIDQNGKGMTFDDGKGHTGSIGGGDVSEADLGVPYYPGSTAVEAGSTKVDTPEGTSFMSTRTTADPVQKIVDFYKGEMEKAGYKVAGTMVSGDIGTVSGNKTDSDVITAMYSHDKDKNVSSVIVTHVVKKGGASPAPSGAPAPSPS